MEYRIIQVGDSGVICDVGALTIDAGDLHFATSDEALHQGLTEIARQRHVMRRTGLSIRNKSIRITCILMGERVPISDPTFMKALEDYLLRFDIVKLAPTA